MAVAIKRRKKKTARRAKIGIGGIKPALGNQWSRGVE